LDQNDHRNLTYLLDHLDKYLLEPAFPSLLHGDLWSGNCITGNDGEAWLIDPAVSVGNFEADLAMTELFGGFPYSFYGAYNEINPIDQGYRERRELYNLYHLLNHLNLFGGSYLGAVRRILRKYTQGHSEK
jgi:fructosamine-3-kinase